MVIKDECADVLSDSPGNRPPDASHATAAVPRKPQGALWRETPSPPPSSPGHNLQNGGSARLVGGGGTGVNPPKGIHHRRADRGRNADKTLYYRPITVSHIPHSLRALLCGHVSQQHREKWLKIQYPCGGKFQRGGERGGGNF